MSQLIVYLKMEQSICLNHRLVHLGDIAKIYCSDPEFTYEVENIRLFRFPDEKNSREIISLMKIIEKIKALRKEAEIISLGENDVLIYYKRLEKKPKWPVYLKVVFICLTVFFGTGISIMAYNNDIGIHTIFSDLYFWIMGVEREGPTLLHLSYAIGLFVGMIIFFNHASRKRLSDEPTPVEVQMRMYEKNVNAALITGSSRKGEEIDVDS